jgi:hypothetical protein
MWADNSGTDATTDTSTAAPIVVINRIRREKIDADLEALCEEIRRLSAQADAILLALWGLENCEA